MRSLRLNANDFTGSFPTSLASLDELGKNKATVPCVGEMLISAAQPHPLFALETLLLNDNLLDGTIPDVFGDWRKLTKLALHGNSFHGTVPPTLCSLASGNLQDLTSDCQGDPPDMYCTCCSQCY